jgi:hypothetical protein
VTQEEGEIVGTNVGPSSDGQYVGTADSRKRRCSDLGEVGTKLSEEYVSLFEYELATEQFTITRPAVAIQSTTAVDILEADVDSVARYVPGVNRVPYNLCNFA